MKIVCVCRGYPTHRPGGMLYVCQDRARALVRAGHEVHVLTTGKTGQSIFDDKGVCVHYLDCESLIYTLRFAQQCSAWVDKFKPDILHLDGFDVNHPWWVDKKNSRCQVAITMHGFGMGAFLTRWNLFLAEKIEDVSFQPSKLAKEAKIISQANYIFAISLHEKWMLEDTYGLYGKVRLLYNPIAPYFYDKIEDQVDRSSFLCLGCKGTNGNRFFSFAVEASKKASVGLMIVTDQPREQMPKMYHQSAGLVLPTYWSQGFDLTIAEALACRRRVIVTATGSYIREAENNPYLHLAPRGDIDAIAEQMQKIFLLGPVDAEHPCRLQHRPDIYVQKWLEVFCKLPTTTVKKRYGLGL